MIQQRSIRNGWVIIALGIIGLLVHGPQAGRLGLYWDESITFLHAMQKVDGDVTKFIFMDAQNFLPSERPLAYLPFVAFRAGFAASLPLAHWFSVFLLVVMTALLAMLARKVVDEAWFSFAVGVIFLTYPLSPLQAIWLTSGFYVWAAILALAATLLFLRGFEARATRQLGWFTLAVLAYLASILTQEEFILFPPTFIVLYLLSKMGQKSSIGQLLWPISVRRLSAYVFGLVLIPVAAYVLWREIALSFYGYRIYSFPATMRDPGVLAQKFLTGIKTAFLPMDDALRQILVEFPPEPGYFFLSAIVSLAVWVIVLRLYSTVARQEPSQENPWPCAAIWGAAMAISGIVFLVVAPVYIGGVVGTGWSSRVNLVMTLGVALAVPGFLGLLVAPYNRLTPFAVLLSVLFLAYAGLTSSFLDIDKLLRPATFLTILSEYSVKHRLVMFGCLIGGTLFILIVTLSSLIGAGGIKHLLWRDRLDVLCSRMRGHALAGVVACLVLLGSLFHFSVKEQYVASWDQHTSMLAQLQALAPTLKDNTFVIMARNRTDPVSPSHGEFSSYLMALYSNKSIMGNMDWQLRFHPDGMDSTYRGRKVRWYDPRAKGSGRTQTPVQRISYDRLLILSFDGSELRMPPKIEVKTEEGGSLVVFNNPDRILSGSTVRTAVRRYLN